MYIGGQFMAASHIDIILEYYSRRWNKRLPPARADYMSLESGSNPTQQNLESKEAMQELL